ncbi:phospholipase effector Tle1 domain-containing protein [Xanthomonas albilineans]|uniref:phospholipase effector Tle1 domain-containing protein n=1 Tax=Xanthomonas albilineans TaxID=29447 RepID=UPI0009BC2EDA|nr:DUF2235 domain-containing protein [Xanthomonas albilineans]
MGNEHTDPKKWPDDVEVYPATAQDLAIYAHSRHALAQFQAPLLVSQQNPHTRLFVACFDGTGNDKHKDPQHITNIGILSDQLDLAYSRGINNIRGHYVPGVGTQDDALTNKVDGAFGYSYGPRMEEMYFRFIDQAKKWHDEDPQAEIRIVSTGFSRGAVTATMFTRMVHERGIQDRKDMKIDQGPHGEILKLTPTHPPLVPPGRTAQVVGLLDPVATGEMNFHDVRLPPSVVSGLQLSARDERRDLFPAKDILHPGHSHDGRFLNLVHPGAHSDIGGSYRLDGLSVRNGNLLTDYVNSLSDKPFLQPRAVSSAPEMNVIHRSEQHGSYYTTTMATTLGHRVHVHDLAGPAMTLAPFDAQSLDAELRAHLPWRPVAVSTEHTDPALPAFFRERPHASAAPPLPAYLQQGATPHAVGAPSTHTASTNADTSSSSSSAAASTPSQAMDKHSRMQDDLVAQQHQQRIQQAQPLAQSVTQTHAPPSHDSAPAHEKPTSVDMQEQARIAQLQQQEQQAQAAREQQQRLAQQHAQLHRQAVDAQQREHEQHHNQDPRSPQHEQRQAAESMLHTPATTKAPNLLLTTAQPLEPGDRGVAVQALQQHLQAIGVTDRDGNAIKDDKHYGPRTQQAVEGFQRLAGREPTGIADTGTLQALQTHAQFAARQKAQHLAPDRYLADHAQPAPSRSSDAITQHSAPPRPDQPPAQQQPAPKALEPYSSPTSPLHALYAQTKATIENRGVSMSEERMHQLVGKMAVQGMTTEGKNDFAVKGDTLYAREFDVPYNHFMLDLREPAPSVQSTLQQVQTQLQIQEAELTAMRQQQQQNQYEHPYSL